MASPDYPCRTDNVFKGVEGGEVEEGGQDKTGDRTAGLLRMSLKDRPDF